MGNLAYPRVAVLASGDRVNGGGGSTAERVIDDALRGETEFTIGVVICNNSEIEVGVYDKVEGLNKKYGLTTDDRIDVVHIGPQTHPSGKRKRGQTEEESEAIVRTLEERSINFVAALGYLRIISGRLLEEWGWQSRYGEEDSAHHGIYHPNARILNNHPGILPFTGNTHGHGTHERALECFDETKLTHTAMTWHLVAETVDAGPVIHEEPVLITPELTADTLGDKVQAVEKDKTSAVLSRHLLLRGQHTKPWFTGIF